MARANLPAGVRHTASLVVVRVETTDHGPDFIGALSAGGAARRRGRAAEEKDIDVKLVNGVLTIRGEKRDEKEEKKKDYYMRVVFTQDVWIDDEDVTRPHTRSDRCGRTRSTNKRDRPLLGAIILHQKNIPVSAFRSEPANPKTSLGASFPRCCSQARFPPNDLCC
jgi:hypothetical protein